MLNDEELKTLAALVSKECDVYYDLVLAEYRADKQYADDDLQLLQLTTKDIKDAKTSGRCKAVSALPCRRG